MRNLIIGLALLVASFGASAAILKSSVIKPGYPVLKVQISPANTGVAINSVKDELGNQYLSGPFQTLGETSYWDRYRMLRAGVKYDGFGRCLEASTAGNIWGATNYGLVTRSVTSADYPLTIINGYEGHVTAAYALRKGEVLYPINGDCGDVNHTNVAKNTTNRSGTVITAYAAVESNFIIHRVVYKPEPGHTSAIFEPMSLSPHWFMRTPKYFNPVTGVITEATNLPDENQSLPVIMCQMNNDLCVGIFSKEKYATAGSGQVSYRKEISSGDDSLGLFYAKLIATYQVTGADVSLEREFYTFSVYGNLAEVTDTIADIHFNRAY